MVNMKIRLTGDKQIDDVLRGLSLEVNHKVLQTAHTSAAKYLVDEAKLEAPEGPTGGTIDSIGVIKSPISKAQELGLITVGPRRGGRYKGYAAHLIEDGTKSRTNKAGANRGVMPARPFMRPSWEKVKDKVIGSINQNLGQALLRFMKRVIRNG